MLKSDCEPTASDTADLFEGSTLKASAIQLEAISMLSASSAVSVPSLIDVERKSMMERASLFFESGRDWHGYQLTVATHGRVFLTILLCSRGVDELEKGVLRRKLIEDKIRSLCELPLQIFRESAALGVECMYFLDHFHLVGIQQ